MSDDPHLVDPKVVRPKSVGIFGGTFDPPHYGHLILAEFVRVGLGLDEVRFVVANDPWQKQHLRQITRAQDRLLLTRAAVTTTVSSPSIAGSHAVTLPLTGGLTVSAVEIDAGGPSFTIDTLASFRDTEPETDWHLLVGADAAAGLDTWHRAAELREIASVVVVNRPGSSTESGVPTGWRSQSVEIPAIDISSTLIRQRVADGSSIRFLTPDAVIALVERLAIYRQGS